MQRYLVAPAEAILALPIKNQRKSVFGYLYFRRFRKAGQFSPVFFKDLIASTLIVIPELAFPWSKLIPGNCLHRLDPALESHSQCRKVAKSLHQRCKRRETRRATPPRPAHFTPHAHRNRHPQGYQRAS